MIEREWRESSDMRVSTLGIGSVLLTAAVLRFWGVAQGLPLALGPDEPIIIERAVQMLKTGDYHPHFFGYPTFTIYLHLAVATLRFIWGAASGLWGSLAEVSAADFYLWSRVVTAALGTATVVLVYQIGMRWGTRHALLAAALLALMPHHVRESHFATTDVPMTFFATLAFLLALEAHERGKLGRFVGAGIAAGLATSSNYHGVVAVLLPLMAAFMTRSADRPSGRHALGATAGFFGALLLTSPFMLLDLPAFLDGFARTVAASSRAATTGGWVLHLTELRAGLGWPTLLLALGALGLFLVRVVSGPGQTRFAMVLVSLAVYVPLVGGRPSTSARDLLPIVPFACLLAAVGVVSGVSLLRRFDIPRWVRTTIIAALTIAALLPPAIKSIQVDRSIGRQVALPPARTGAAGTREAPGLIGRVTGGVQRASRDSSVMSALWRSRSIHSATSAARRAADARALTSDRTDSSVGGPAAAENSCRWSRK